MWERSSAVWQGDRQIKRIEAWVHGTNVNVLARDGWRGGCHVEDEVVIGKLLPLDSAEQFSLYALEHRSPTFLAPGTGFVEDNSSTAWGGGWGWFGFGGDSNALYSLYILFLLLLHHLTSDHQALDSGGWGPCFRKLESLKRGNTLKDREKTGGELGNCWNRSTERWVSTEPR